MLAISMIAYMAAFFMLILLAWMVRDFFLPKKQEFYESEMPCIDMLRRELSCMENVIKKHHELVLKAQEGFEDDIIEELRLVYAEAAGELSQINYDHNVFVDKGITWPGQRCYDIYKRLTACEVPLGFRVSNLADKAAVQPQNATAAICIDCVDDVKCKELECLATKFCKNKLKVLKRLEIYK